MPRPSLARVTDAESLVDLHERLLFHRAYPRNRHELTEVENQLRQVTSQVAKLAKADADLSALDPPEVSGIAGTSVTSNFSYTLVRWLISRYPNQLSIDWDWFENEEQFGATMPRFLPLLEEDAMVEAHVPYREWLDEAKGRKNEVAWLIERFDSLPVNDRHKAELYDSLKLHITWRFGNRSSRTSMRLPSRNIFYHSQPLIRRRDISLVSELNSATIPVVRLSHATGKKMLNIARETSAVRYRELHGFTFGNAARVLKADLGRGTLAFVFGVAPENRLPLRAYHAAIIFKNGVPVAYFEGLSLFERMESGFNLYYTFRDGETAWLYARILRLMRQLLGVTVFSIDPYQIGHENEEGVESGAFWFYRKLGFRSVRPELMKVTLTEEKRMAKNPRHRTTKATLRKLASGHMLFEMPEVAAREWDQFEVRKIGLAVLRRMAREFNGEPAKIQANSSEFVHQMLGLSRLRTSELANNLALVLAMIPDLSKWSAEEKDLAAKILSAKGARDESVYLKKMQKHASLRASLIKIGSRSFR